MSDTTLLAEFDAPETMLAALGAARQARHTLLDAFTPYPVSGLDEELPREPSRIRVAMLVTGIVTGAAAYMVQWWSAVYAYPLNVGARPLNSWPVFVLAPFEIAVLAAAVAGLIAFCHFCGLPRLHNSLFEIPGFERATIDRFFLLVKSAPSDEHGHSLRHLLESKGALVVSELRDP
jgi:hypothetical protein